MNKYNSVYQKVFEIHGLRRKILSFLRKDPYRKCILCKLVCVWNKKLNNSYIITNSTCYCIDCYIKKSTNV